METVQNVFCGAPFPTEDPAVIQPSGSYSFLPLGILAAAGGSSINGVGDVLGFYGTNVHIRILASHPQVADLYEVAVKELSGQLSLEWPAKEGQQQWRETREGANLLRTNLTGTTAPELWEKYMQLTEVEAAFRALKSGLSIRPLFHQLKHRVKAHVMVAFLGYAQ